MSVVINNVNAVIKSLVNKKLNEWTVLNHDKADKLFYRLNPTFNFSIIEQDVRNEILDTFNIDIGFRLEKHLRRTNGSGMGWSNRIMKALNKIGALSRINASEILRNYNKGYDLYGRPMPKLSFDQMITDLWENQRRLLALGARLATGLDKQMIFKTNNTEELKCFKFSIRQDDYYIRAHSTDYANMGYHLCLAFEVLKKAGTLEYVSGAKCPIGSNCILIYRPVEVNENKIDLPTKPVPVRSNEKYSEQIDYFSKQIEELNISIQQYDDEIFRLSGLSSKAKSERENLIKIIDLLKF